MTKPWTMHRREITDLYIKDGRILEDVRNIMKERHGFQASIRAYRHHFDRWGVGKYNRRDRQNRPPSRPVAQQQLLQQQRHQQQQRQQRQQRQQQRHQPATPSPSPVQSPFVVQSPSPKTEAMSPGTAATTTAIAAAATAAVAAASGDAGRGGGGFLGDSDMASPPPWSVHSSPPPPNIMTPPATPLVLPALGLVIAEATSEHVDDWFEAWRFEQSHRAALHGTAECQLLPYPSRARWPSYIDQERRCGPPCSDSSYAEPQIVGHCEHNCSGWPFFSDEHQYSGAQPPGVISSA